MQIHKTHSRPASLPLLFKAFTLQTVPVRKRYPPKGREADKCNLEDPGYSSSNISQANNQESYLTANVNILMLMFCMYKS